MTADCRERLGAGRAMSGWKTDRPSASDRGSGSHDLKAVRAMKAPTSSPFCKAGNASNAAGDRPAVFASWA